MRVDCNKGGETHLPLPLSSTLQAACTSIQIAVFSLPAAASRLLQAVFLVDLQISCRDTANQHCVSTGKALAGLVPASGFFNEGYQHFGTARWQPA